MIPEESNTSSDELIDIQIEESLVRETLMVIDSANCKEDAFTLVGFLIVLILAIVIGLFGPPTDVNTDVGKMYKPGIEKIEVESRRIQPSMRTFKIDIFFDKPKKEPWFESKASFKCRVIKYKRNIKISDKVKKIVNKDLIFGKNDAESQVFNILYDKSVDYDSVDVIISDFNVDPRLSNLFVRFNNGTEAHTLFQIYVRASLVTLCLVLLMLFIIRLKPLKHKLWHIEQKLTVPLAVLTIFLNNLLFPVYSFFPSDGFVYYDIIVKAAVLSFFNYFILVLFSSLNKNNRRMNSYFFAPKILLSLAQFAVRVGLNIAKEIENKEMKNYSSIIAKLQLVDKMIEYFFLICIFAAVALAVINVDITERYKLIIYIVTYATSMFTVYLAKFIATSCKFGQETSVEFTTCYSVINVYVMLMIYFHWPYEILNDQTYDESGKSSQMQSDFLVNNNE